MTLSPVDQILSLVPTNHFEALATGNMLQIVFCALLSGIALTLISPEKAEPVVPVFDGFTDALIKIVDLVMRLAPVGMFALVMAVTAEFGFGVLGALSWVRSSSSAWAAASPIRGLRGDLEDSRRTVAAVGAILSSYDSRASCSVQLFQQRSDAAHQQGDLATLPWCQRTRFLLRPASGRYGQHGRHRTLPGSRRSLHRTSIRSTPHVHRPGGNHPDGHFSVDWNSSRAGCRNCDARDGAESGRRARGWYRTDRGIYRPLDLCRTVVNVRGDAAVVAASEGELEIASADSH